MILQERKRLERQTIGVLLVEDDREDAVIFRRYAQGLSAYELKVDHEEDPRNIDKYLGSEDYDLVFLDQRLGGGMTGLDVLRRIRSSWLYVPVIILTGTGDEHTAVEMMKSGATDYLTKETFNIDILNRVVRYALEQRRLAIKDAQAKEALRESELRYRTLFESAPLGIRIETMDGVLLEANENMLHMMGCSKEDLGRIDLRKSFQNKGDRELLLEEIRGEGFVRGFDMNLKRKDGVLYEARLNVTKMTLGGRELLLTIAEDITEKNRLEAQLQHAQRMEGLGTLAGGIAHNFNNLLMGIMGNASLLLLDADYDSPEYEKLKKIERLVNSGSLLTRQLLGYARKGYSEVKPVSVNAVVKETSDTFAMTRKDIIIYHGLDERTYPIKADQGQIEQILWNLYVNAADAMPNGGELFLSTANVSNKQMVGKPYKVRPGNYVLITVRDTGIGMDKSTMERVFEPFFTTKGFAKGTGLGLSSVYGMVKSHSGYIDVESERGKGSTFNIYLPATHDVIPAAEVDIDKIEKGRDTLLVVDDEAMVVEVAREMFEFMGYTVFTAKGGKEAVEIFKIHRKAIDMVILDIIMPDMNGGETYDRLKEIDSSVKVLLASGCSIDAQKSEIKDRDYDGFIQKPFNIKEVSQKIRSILSTGEST